MHNEKEKLSLLPDKRCFVARRNRNGFAAFFMILGAVVVLCVLIVAIRFLAWCLGANGWLDTILLFGLVGVGYLLVSRRLREYIYELTDTHVYVYTKLGSIERRFLDAEMEEIQYYGPWQDRVPELRNRDVSLKRGTHVICTKEEAWRIAPDEAFAAALEERFGKKNIPEERDV